MLREHRCWSGWLVSTLTFLSASFVEFHYCWWPAHSPSAAEPGPVCQSWLPLAAPVALIPWTPSAQPQLHTPPPGLQHPIHRQADTPLSTVFCQTWLFSYFKTVFLACHITICSELKTEIGKLLTTSGLKNKNTIHKQRMPPQRNTTDCSNPYTQTWQPGCLTIISLQQPGCLALPVP